MGMNRIEVMSNFWVWDDMIDWCTEHFGECQNWSSFISEPDHLKKDYRWARGMHGDKFDGSQQACLWIPDGSDYTPFALRWL